MHRLSPLAHRPADPGSSRATLSTLANAEGSGPLVRVVLDHADMVYATCRRVLGNESEAADVAQETFFQFLKNPGRIRGSVAAWLHQVATRRSIDLIRRNSARRRREEAYVADSTPASDSWAELEPLVDEALAALPAAEREILVEHFLERRNMGDIGRRHGISQPTVSRRVAAALDRLREELRGQGVMIATTGLEPFLASLGETAPAAVLQGLGKMVLAHAAAPAAAGGGWGIGHGAGAAALAAALVGAGFLAFSARRPPRPAVPTNQAPPVPASVSYGFATSVVWSAGPAGFRVSRQGTNFALTNRSGSNARPPASPATQR